MSEEIDKSIIGIRSQEFHEGLKDVINFPYKDMYMENTILIGKAATIAAHLKGLDYVDDYTALIGLASQLGITSTELRSVLKELQEVEFISIVMAGSNIKRIELRIPELRDGYSDLGERWLQLNPSEIEQASISVLENVATFPQKETLMRDIIGLGSADFEKLLEIAKAGILIDRYEHDGESILYSPLTMEEKPESLLSLAKQFPEDRIISSLSDIKSYQGAPLEMMNTNAKGFATQALKLGVLCPVQIAGSTATKTFLFTPQGGLHQEERVILEKARAILSCVRYGEHYAEQRKIKYPRSILEKLKNDKTFKYSRPDFLEQYGLLATQQIGVVTPDRFRSGFYNFRFLDTPENMRALNIAIDLVEIGQSPVSKLSIDAEALLNVSGAFSSTLSTRARIGREVQVSRETARDCILTLTKLARGVTK